MPFAAELHQRLLDHPFDYAVGRIGMASAVRALRRNDTQALRALATHGDQPVRTKILDWYDNNPGDAARSDVLVQLCVNQRVDSAAEADAIVSRLSGREAQRAATVTRSSHTAAALLAISGVDIAQRVAANRGVNADVTATAIEAVATSGHPERNTHIRRALTRTDNADVLSRIGRATLRYINRLDSDELGAIAGGDRPDEAAALLARINELTATHPELAENAATLTLAATLQDGIDEAAERNRDWLVELATSTNPADLDTLLKEADRRSLNNAAALAEAVWANPAAFAAHRTQFGRFLSVAAEQRIAAAATTAADVAAICAVSGNPTLLDHTSVDPVDVLDAMVAADVDAERIASTFNHLITEPGRAEQLISRMPVDAIPQLADPVAFNVIDTLLGNDDDLWEALEQLADDTGNLTIGELCANIRTVAGATTINV